MARRRTLVAAGTVTALVAALGIAQLAPGAAPVARAEGLTPYAGCDDLLTHYRQALRASASAWGVGTGGYGGRGVGGVLLTSGAKAEQSVANVPAPRAAADSGATGGQAVGNGATGTNLQEQGVDEPDLVKLADGRLIALAQNRLQVMSAAADPRLLGSTTLGGKQGYVSGELLVVGTRVLVVSSEWRQDPQPQSNSPRGAAGYLRMRPGTPTTRLLLLDVSGTTPRLLEEATYDGSYVSARLTGQTVRLVTSSRPRVTSTQPQYTRQPTPVQARHAERVSLAANRAAADEVTLDEVLPQVARRNAGGAVLGTGPAVSCSQTSYAQDGAGDSTLLVTTLRPSVGLGATDSDAVTTDGDLVYASADRLYVATSRWGTTGPVGGPATDVAVMPAAEPVEAPDSTTSNEDQPQPADDPSATPTATVSASPSPSVSPIDEVTTDLHAFDVTGESTRYVGSGAVPGYVLGRWALSEDKGVLRVATTRAPPWQQADPGGRQAQTSSMLVKLAEQDGTLVETGRVEGLGKSERIQAVRYFGDLAAVVTFRQTDPLYLVDLAGPPKVLGELKVPGFSTYLHPLGGGLLLGLGQEAASDGMVTGSQVSVFDINDPANPRQVDRLQLGTGFSPAQDDSRAFSYDPKRRMAMFAFSSYDKRGYQGTFGALGIAVSATGQLSKVGLLEVASNAPTQRVLYDGDHVYAVSDSGVAAGDPATMSRTGQADFAR